MNQDIQQLMEKFYEGGCTDAEEQRLHEALVQCGEADVEADRRVLEALEAGATRARQQREHERLLKLAAEEQQRHKGWTVWVRVAACGLLIVGSLLVLNQLLKMDETQPPLLAQVEEVDEVGEVDEVSRPQDLQTPSRSIHRHARFVEPEEVCVAEAVEAAEVRKVPEVEVVVRKDMVVVVPEERYEEVYADNMVIIVPEEGKKNVEYRFITLRERRAPIEQFLAML